MMSQVLLKELLADRVFPNLAGNIETKLHEHVVIPIRAFLKL